MNGLVGIKPTVGLLSNRGIIPISHSQDTAGPMARSVRDAALLLSAMNERGVTYLAFLDRRDLKGVRLGIARQFFGSNPDVQRIAKDALELLRRLGAELVDPVDLPPTTQYGDAELELLLFEFKAGLNGYLAGRGADVSTLRALIEFNDRNASREMPYFGQELFLKAEAKTALDSASYADARSKCKVAAAGIDAAMETNKLDAIVAPTDGPAWLTDFINGDHFTQSCSTPAAVAGYPHITVPCGDVNGLPIGLSFFGRANSEGPLIRYAYAFEQATRARRTPKYLDTVKRAKTDI